MRKLLFVICVFAFSIFAADGDAKKLNVLWLIAEDMGPHLSCYGTRQVWTPNIDKLASEGVRYTRAYTTAPVCSPSRSAFMTGMYQTTIGAHHHRSHKDDNFPLPEGVKLLTHWIKDAGYFTANVVNTGDPEVRGTGKTDWNFNGFAKPFDSSNWSELKTHQPFYAQINFEETHRGGAWNSADKHIEKKADPAKVDLPPYYPDDPVARKDWAQYLNSAMALDKKVGVILKKLEEDGLAENTVVFFFGDNGQAHVRGKQWCYESGLIVPLIIRWPKNVAAPKQIKPGSVSDQFIEAIDFTATTLSIAGLKKPEKMQGRVFLGDNAEPAREFAFGARDRCDETMERIRTVRDSRYRYIKNFMPERPFMQSNRYKEEQYPVFNLMLKLHAEGKLTPVQEFLMAPTKPEEELYDLEKDPYEINNLAKSPEHQEILKKLRAELERWIEATNDQGRIPEPPEIAEYWLKQAKVKHPDKKKE